jgi:arylsulfatase A-like enzyme
MVDEALHYHLDWTPTLMELIGRDRQWWPELWDGQAFTDTIRTGKPRGRDELILSQCAHVCQRSVRFNQGKLQWLYIRTYHDGLHPFPKHMLFDLASDPHEQNDVADQHPGVLREATWRLMQWHDEQMARMVEHASDVTDPMWTVMDEGGPFHARPDGSTNQPKSFPGYLQRLRDTGRTEAADDLARRYPAHSGANS